MIIILMLWKKSNARREIGRERLLNNREGGLGSDAFSHQHHLLNLSSDDDHHHGHLQDDHLQNHP